MERTDYDLLSVDEVARTIGQSVKSLRRMIAEKAFPDGFPAPKQKRWKWSVVREWVIRRELMHEMGLSGSAQSGTNVDKQGQMENRTGSAPKSR